MKTVAIIPIKLNSERFPGKNIKSFTNGKPLISYILNTMLQIADLDEIYVYCSSNEIIKYLPNGIKFLKRDTYYDLPTTSFNEVLISFAELIESDIYVLTHATAPFISAKTVSKGIEAVKSGNFDSALSVLKIQEFLWKNNQPFNYQIKKIPRTQDLEALYTETCGLYVYTRNLILEEQRRIGDSPYLLEVSKIEAIDINEKVDFQIADAVYQMIYIKGNIDG